MNSNLKKYFVENNPYALRSPDDARLFVTADDSKQKLGNSAAIERGEAMYRQSQANQPAISETNLGGSPTLATAFNAQANNTVEPAAPVTPITSPETIVAVENQPVAQQQIVTPAPVGNTVMDSPVNELVSPILEPAPIVDTPILSEQPVIPTSTSLGTETPIVNEPIFTEPIIASAPELVDEPEVIAPSLDDAGQVLDNPSTFNDQIKESQEQTIPTEIVEPVPAISTDKMMQNIEEVETLIKEIRESILKTNNLLEKYNQFVRRIAEEAYEIEQQREKDLSAINSTIDQARSVIMTPEQQPQFVETTPSIGL